MPLRLVVVEGEAKSLSRSFIAITDLQQGCIPRPQAPSCWVPGCSWAQPPQTRRWMSDHAAPAAKETRMRCTSAARTTIASTLAAMAGVASAQVMTVTTGEDDVDFSGQQQVTDLPGPDGLVSLREAVTAANNTPGPQSIHFAIPRSTWWNLFPNQAGCRIDNPLFLTDPGTTIDFTTQTLLTGDTNPGGWEVAVFYAGATTFVSQFMVQADNCTIKGMDYVGGNSTGPSVRLYSSNNHILASTGFIASVALDPSIRTRFSGNIIGGTAPEDRNELRLVWFVHGSSGNTVVGNTIRSVKITGDTLSGTCDNNRIGGPTPQERNTISGNGASGEEGIPTGIQVEISHAVGTILDGNYIGTTTDGMAAWPGANGVSGVKVGLGAAGTVIRNNLISGIARTGTFHYAGQRFGTGIVVTDGSSDTLITGNRLGRNADGSAAIINVQGMLVARSTGLAAPVSGVIIGGPDAGQGNTIASNEQAGIVVHSTVSGVRISGNSVFDNGTMGLDLLGALGPTPNDAQDTDAGGNNLQNFPVLAAAETGPTGTRVRGTLNSTPNRAFIIEFFASGSCDPSGYGEGATFLGSAAVVTDAAGNAPLDALLSTPVVLGSAITATTIADLSGDTSEFSACITTTDATCRADFNADGQADFFDYLDFAVAFDAEDPSADFNGDQQVDFFDYLDFVQAFDAGCE
jgi:parallel beta-helix repeat protein